MSARSLVLDESGAEIERTYYDPFGTRVKVDGSPAADGDARVTLGFTGHEHDDDLGLVNMRGRIYDPAQRRFLTPDPIVSNSLFGQSYNPYSYVLNNPINLSDPSGYQNQSQGSDAEMVQDTPPEPGDMQFAGDPLKSCAGSTDANGDCGPPAPQPPQIAIATDAASGTAKNSMFGDTTGLPIVQRDLPSGPGTDDPFDVNPPELRLLPTLPVPVIDQLLAGEHAGGRRAFISPTPSGFGLTLAVALSPERFTFVTLRPQFIDVPSPAAQARAEVALHGMAILATLLPPGPQDDLIVMGGEIGNAGSLAAHELAGGHTLARHVGLGAPALDARLAEQASLTVASSFASQAEAQAAANVILRGNSAAISAWAEAGAVGRFTVSGPFSGGMARVIGGYEAEITGATFVLKGNGHGSYFILTGFRCHER